MSEVHQDHEATMPPEIAVEQGLSLRFLVPTDDERMFEILQADPEIQNRVTWTHGLSDVEAVRGAIVEFQRRKSIRYAVVQNEVTVGYVGMWHDYGYMDNTEHDGWFGLGYFLDKNYRGQGIVQKATEGMMSRAEDVFDVQRWAVYVEDDNDASQAVLKKLGFEATEYVFDEPVMHTDERRWEKVVA